MSRLEFIKFCVFALILLKGSWSDITTRQVPDHISVMLAITGLIGTSLTELPAMLISSLFVPTPLLAAAFLKPNSIGGADIKIMAASAFLLGFEKGLAALVIGLMLAVLCTAVIRKAKKLSMKASLPLAPYLSAGCVIAIIL
jgi:leader peptidase (prepilin peptidase)/N-methyltransferase